MQARRGWVERRHVLNARPWAELSAWLARSPATAPHAWRRAIPSQSQLAPLAAGSQHVGSPGAVHRRRSI